MVEKRPKPASRYPELISLAGGPSLAIDIPEAYLALHALEEFCCRWGCGGVGPEIIALKHKLRQYVFRQHSAEED